MRHLWNNGRQLAELTVKHAIFSLYLDAPSRMRLACSSNNTTGPVAPLASCWRVRRRRCVASNRIVRRKSSLRRPPCMYTGIVSFPCRQLAHSSLTHKSIVLRYAVKAFSSTPDCSAINKPVQTPTRSFRLRHHLNTLPTKTFRCLMTTTI